MYSVRSIKAKMEVVLDSRSQFLIDPQLVSYHYIVSSDVPNSA